MDDREFKVGLGRVCQKLLNSLDSKEVTKTSIASEYLKAWPSAAKSIGSLKVQLTKISQGGLNHSILTTQLIDFLTDIDKRTEEKKENDSSIFFYYWSEGKNHNESDDRLKIALIKLNLKILTHQRRVDCTLQYVNHDEIIIGACRQVADGKVLSFTFEQGTSFLMSLSSNLHDCAGKFYKGTYVATPGGYTSCGIAIFEVCDKKQTIENIKDIPGDKKERIKAELYKKRFLVLSDQAAFDSPLEFKTSASYNALEDIEGPYIRYRKSGTTKKIHGDFIKIEKFGRAIYKGVETENRNGRCFIQTDANVKNAKNLIIELYQESDKDKRSFEFRSPHSFMIFDVTTTSNTFVGYALRPKTNLKPHGSKCFLLKVDIKDWNENDFMPSEFEEDRKKFGEYLSALRKLHTFITDVSYIDNFFIEL